MIITDGFLGRDSAEQLGDGWLYSDLPNIIRVFFHLSVIFFFANMPIVPEEHK